MSKSLEGSLQKRYTGYGSRVLTTDHAFITVRSGGRQPYPDERNSDHDVNINWVIVRSSVDHDHNDVFSSG